MSEEIEVRVTKSFETVRVGEHFCISTDNERMMSLLGAGYLQRVVVASEPEPFQPFEVTPQRPKRTGRPPQKARSENDGASDLESA